MQTCRQWEIAKRVISRAKSRRPGQGPKVEAEGRGGGMEPLPISLGGKWFSIVLDTGKDLYETAMFELAILQKWVPYSQRYLFNAVPDTNPTNPNRGKTSESVHCTILNKLCACQRMRHRPSARPLYRFGRLALMVTVRVTLTLPTLLTLILIITSAG